MKILTACDKCGARFKVDGAMVGKRARCTRCQHVMTVRAREGAGESAKRSATAAAPERPSGRRENPSIKRSAAAALTRAPTGDLWQMLRQQVVQDLRQRNLEPASEEQARREPRLFYPKVDPETLEEATGDGIWWQPLLGMLIVLVFLVLVLGGFWGVHASIGAQPEKTKEVVEVQVQPDERRQLTPARRSLGLGRSPERADPPAQEPSRSHPPEPTPPRAGQAERVKIFISP